MQSRRPEPQPELANEELVPDRPLRRCFVGFAVRAIPVGFGVGLTGRVTDALGAALVVGCVFGILSLFGRRILDFLIGFILRIG